VSKADYLKRRGLTGSVSQRKETNRMALMNELRPCPLCGGPTGLMPEDDVFPRWAIFCHECHMMFSFPFVTLVNPDPTPEERLKHLIEAFNRRDGGE